MFNFIEAKFARDNFKKSIDDLSLVLGQRRLKDCRDYRGNDQEVATSLGFVIINYEKLCKSWEAEGRRVVLVPPEKIIRDFNNILFSSKYDLNVIEVLGTAIVAERNIRYLKYTDCLFSYYERIFLFELKDKEEVKMNDFEVGRIGLERIMSVLVNSACSSLSFNLDEDKFSELKGKEIRKFIDFHLSEWEIDKDFSDMKWGIWWFIDTKYSQEQKTLAQKNWEKLGNYSGYSKAEMSNGTLTVNDLVTGKVTIFSGSDFYMCDRDIQYENHLKNKEKLDDRWNSFAERKFSQKIISEKKQIIDEIERIHILEMECYSKAYSAYENVQEKEKANIGEVIRFSSALILSECLNEFTTYFIRKKNISYKIKKIDFETRLLVLAIAINGYYVNFHRDFFVFDTDTEDLLGNNLCRKIDYSKTYVGEFIKEDTTLPMWALAKRYPDDVEEAIEYLKKLNMMLNFDGVTFDLNEDKRSLHYKDFSRLMNGIFSGLTQKYNWTYPIPSPFGGTSDDYKEGVWPDSNMKM